MDRKVKRAHRVAYERFNGPIRKGMIVRHTCDNPACVNPGHLITGTQKDNMDDKVKAGRQAKGESIGQSKLTEEQVLAIRELNAKGVAIPTLVRMYDISRSTVRGITTGKNWKHVILKEGDKDGE